MKPLVIMICLSAVVNGCIELDFLFFETEEATSLEEDYHGLPLTLSNAPRVWMANAEVEREIYLESATGTSLTTAERKDSRNYVHGVFLKAPPDCPPETCPLAGRGLTFLYQHGNSGHMYRYWYRAVALWNMGANVFIYTYRGYGLSGGEASRKNILEDAEAAMTYVSGREDVNPDRIIAYGYSMGGIPTSYLLGRSKHAGEFLAGILESALDSPDDTLSLSTSTEFPNGFFMDETLFDGPTFIKDAPTLPILHIHGGKDERVVMQQAEQYYEVLKVRDNYTHYLGKTEKAHEGWVKIAGHRNIPIASFKGEFHIPDYYNHKKNPGHCCIHPMEYTDPRHADFLDAIGKTTGQNMARDAERYMDLVCSWVLSILPDNK